MAACPDKSIVVAPCVKMVILNRFDSHTLDQAARRYFSDLVRGHDGLVTYPIAGNPTRKESLATGTHI
jgi:hypothetical protein